MHQTQILYYPKQNLTA